MPKVTLGLIQLADSSNLKDNLEKALDLSRQAIRKGAQIVCLQELYRSMYFCQDYDPKNFNLAEPLKGPSFQAFSKLAKAQKAVIVVPIFEKRAQGVYHNSALVIDADGSLAGHYRKMHIPDDPNFYEKYYFAPGDLGFKSFRTRYAHIGVLICWDQWFPEAARLCALSGAQILFYPTAIGWQDADKAIAHAQHTGWETIQRGHAVANEVFVAVANRVGTEGAIHFWGQSFVADPFGSMIKSASCDKEEALIVDCDLDLIEETRQSWPFLRDRRIDAYGNIAHRFLDETLPQPAKPKKSKTKNRRPISAS